MPMASEPEQWPFEDPPNVAILTTANVLERGAPILLVTHDADDGGWQFLCGTTTDSKLARIVGLEEIVSKDRTVAQLANLPLGWRAHRKSIGAEWQREPQAADGNDNG
jgi:hypothetical protein